MSKEFHVFTHQDTSYEQAFVFEVERHVDDDFVEFRDLYMVTTTKHGELKTRICFDQMIQAILKTEGGNIEDSSVNTIIDMFKDLIPKEKHNEIMTDLGDKEIKNMDPEELITASDYAVMVQEAKILEQVENENTRGTSQRT